MCIWPGTLAHTLLWNITLRWVDKCFQQILFCTWAVSLLDNNSSSQSEGIGIWVDLKKEHDSALFVLQYVCLFKAYLSAAGCQITPHSQTELLAFIGLCSALWGHNHFQLCTLLHQSRHLSLHPATETNYQFSFVLFIENQIKIVPMTK